MIRYGLGSGPECLCGRMRSRFPGPCHSYPSGISRILLRATHAVPMARSSTLYHHPRTWLATNAAARLCGHQPKNRGFCSSGHMKYACIPPFSRCSNLSCVLRMCCSFAISARRRATYPSLLTRSLRISIQSGIMSHSERVNIHMRAPLTKSTYLAASGSTSEMRSRSSSWERFRRCVAREAAGGRGTPGFSEGAWNIDSFTELRLRMKRVWLLRAGGAPEPPAPEPTTRPCAACPLLTASALSAPLKEPSMVTRVRRIAARAGGIC
mmetsp:Transcript_50494/g.161560  ORF Transcript_50494/g.161560 Transcript_50494/m.161560 type:complete len:267 (-) Transcript_50494:175-975(-)